MEDINKRRKKGSIDDELRKNYEILLMYETKATRVIKDYYYKYNHSSSDEDIRIFHYIKS